MKVCIVTPGGLPIPAIKGGAVQTLIENLIKENNYHKKIEMVITIPFDSSAEQCSKELYPNIEFKYIKIPFWINLFDNCLYKIAKICFKNKNLISYKNNFKVFYYSYKVAQILKKENFDKVVIENNLRTFWSLKFYRNFKKYKNKYYLHLHNIPKTTFGCKNIIQNCKKILCVSEFVANEIRKNDNAIGPIDSRQIVIYKNTVDLKVFKKIEKSQKITQLKEKYGIKDYDFVLLYAGRLIPEKGIEELLKAFKEIDIKNLKLLIVGSSYYKTEVINKFEAKLKDITQNIQDKIVFTGYVDYKDMPYIYNLSEIAVLPSIWEEPAGMTILESLACGKPVITTKSGGIVEYANSECAIILERDENLINNIKENILKLIEKKEKRQEMSQNALKITKSYGTELYYQNFIEILKEE